MNLVALRRLLVAACLALLAGCGPGAIIPIAPAPANLIATPANASVSLAWTASTGATSYNIKRSTVSGGPYQQISAPTSPSYTDSSVTNGTAYFYVVSAVNAGGESANSAQATATPAVPTAPAAPTNLTANVGDAQVGLTWTASTGATGYHVKRATVSGGPYTQIAAPTTATYTDTLLTNGTAYYYVVSAFNATGESPNSTQVIAVPSPPPPTTFGTWTNVTPAGVDLTDANLGVAGCNNAGARTIQPDPAHPSTVYAQFSCQGIWKSTDYGVTWVGPINTGTNAALVGDCSGGITISPTSTAVIPTIYESCIRGSGIGFWKSVDGGVNWTSYAVTPGGARQDYNPPVVDPYDQNHLLMTGHEFDSTVESMDGGQTWTSVPLNNGMLQNGRTAFIFFINTGSPSTTRANWLWLGEQNGGAVGTWRTSNSGITWTQVEKNEHLVGASQIYQPDTNGVIFIAGAYSPLGFGVLRSTDYGQTWTHVGMSDTETLVFGTPKNVYGMGPGGTTAVFELASQPGTGTWVAPGPPSGFTDPVQVGIVNDGTNNVLIGAMATNGIWRYVEP